MKFHSKPFKYFKKEKNCLSFEFSVDFIQGLVKTEYWESFFGLRVHN